MSVNVELPAVPGSVGIDQVRVWANRYSNWGRWGEDDQRGALNLVTPDKVAAAARLARTGKVISLGLPFDSNGPQSGRWGGRWNPIHTMLQSGGDIELGAQDHLAHARYTDDAVSMPLQCATQWDALAHVFFEGRMYNGYPTSDVDGFGAKHNGIENQRADVVSRGVLLDIPRLLDRPWLEDGEAITPEQLDACLARQDLQVGPGDVVLIRTGQLAHVRDRGYWGEYDGGPAPGLGARTIPWFAERQVAAYATDTWGTEVLPNDTDGVFQPLHIVLLVHVGVLIGEIFDLEELGVDCAGDGVYEFLFVAPPLPITGAVGSPINPLAVK